MNYPQFNPYTDVPYQMQRQNMQNQQLMQQQIMPQQQIQMQQQMPSPTLSAASRPVTSREEAIAVSADFSGAPMVFPDITHNCVYIKRWNIQTGAAEFMDYIPAMAAVQQQEQKQATPAFASLQELADLKDTVDNLQRQIEQLRQERSTEKPNGKAGTKNDAK